MEPDGRPGALIRRGLVAALVAAIGFSVLFFQPFDPRVRDGLGAMIGAETLSVIALVLLLAFRAGNRRLAAVGVTFVAALMPTCEGVAIAHFPGGSPGPVPPSSVPLVLANLAVMVLAALNVRGDNRVTMLVVTGLVIAAICAVDLAIR
jgi:hypothetical protein